MSTLTCAANGVAAGASAKVGTNFTESSAQAFTIPLARSLGARLLLQMEVLDFAVVIELQLHCELVAVCILADNFSCVVDPKIHCEFVFVAEVAADNARAPVGGANGASASVCASASGGGGSGSVCSGDEVSGGGGGRGDRSSGNCIGAGG